MDPGSSAIAALCERSCGCRRIFFKLEKETMRLYPIKSQINCLKESIKTCERKTRLEISWVTYEMINTKETFNVSGPHSYPKEVRSNEHSSSRNSGASTHPLAHAWRHKRTHASYDKTVGQAACPLHTVETITYNFKR
jgi:hypothetical protein